jgi:hypothetical protein
MKKFVTFAMVLTLGLFLAVGCSPAKKETKKEGKTEVTAPAGGAKTEEAKTGEAAPKTEEKAPEKK